MCMPKRQLNGDDFSVSGDVIIQVDFKIAANLALERGGESNCTQCAAL